jgi:class 3 adenylate cyclase
VAASRTSADIEFGYETQHLVVGFVDLVGSTAFSEQVDVASLGAALGEFETTASDVVVAAGGRVVKLIGDEIMFVATSIDAASRSPSTLPTCSGPIPSCPRFGPGSPSAMSSSRAVTASGRW